MSKAKKYIPMGKPAWQGKEMSKRPVDRNDKVWAKRDYIVYPDVGMEEAAASPNEGLDFIIKSQPPAEPTKPILKPRQMGLTQLNKRVSVPIPEQEQSRRRVIEWLLGDDTGISSKALVAHMLGVDGETMAPWDASDRGRCIRLLKLMPEWIPRLDEMASVNNAWKACLPLIKAGLSQPTSGREETR